MYPKKISVVFPGQGSQYTGMLSDYFKNQPLFKKVFFDASNILNLDLFKIIEKGTDKELTRTEITQPLMLVADVAMWNLISKRITKPVCLAGHSLGEYAALVAAEVLSFKDSLHLVQIRAKLMQEAVPEGEGGIAAIIGLKEQEVNDICSEISKDAKFLVSVANINSNTQIVISGTKVGVKKAIDKCKSTGAKRAISLPMSVPAHCMLMKDASDKFSLALKKIQFKSPSIPIIHNIDSLVENDVEAIKTKLVKQIYSPVRWLDTIKLMNKMEINTFIECGPNKVLCGLIKQVFPEVQTIYSDEYENYLSLSNG
tara:strand:- start:6246 stop:7184 length:939 start_codon:yes stop_codon:yes gene_type:complete